MSVQLHPPLRVEDAEVLWHFEIENRAWFERWVGPRPDTYWELGSLTKFIEAQLADPDAMYLVWDGATLLGRVNLTGIAQGVAQLGGYRIGEAHVGRGGVASAAVAIALDEARALGLWAVEARVALGNPASVRVLEKCGFHPLRDATGRRARHAALLSQSGLTAG